MLDLADSAGPAALEPLEPFTEQGALRVLVAGGNGVLGWRTVRGLAARGHEVHALVRSATAADLVEELGATAHLGDLLGGFPPDSLPEGIDVVVHAATAIPVSSRPRRAEWRHSDRVRLEGARALADWGASRGMRLFVLPSTVWVAQPPDGSPFDEGADVRPTEYHLSAANAEAFIQERARAGGFAAAILRFGWYYGADVPHTLLFRSLIKRGLLPMVGRGDSYWSVIHLDDAAGAVVRAAEVGRGGLWHVVDDEPVMIGEFLAEFATLLGGPRPRSVPAWLARLMAGPYPAEFLTRSTRTSNARFKAELGWRPEYPGSSQGLRQVVGEWAEE